jgi:SAM-dependent methyltransferase
LSESREGDAWGRALLDHHAGREVPTPVLEVDDGGSGPAMHPEWFFRTFDTWDWWERELLPEIDRGPVLDLGCGAGRVALYLQERGLDVTAVDVSPGAVEVCRARGVRDARVGDLNDSPSDQR